MNYLYINNQYITTLQGLKECFLEEEARLYNSSLFNELKDYYRSGEIEEFLRDIGEDYIVTRIKDIDSTSDKSIIEALSKALCNETYKVELDPFQLVDVITTSYIQNVALFEVKVKKNAVESLDLKIRIPQIDQSKSKTIYLSQHQLGETNSLEFTIPKQTEELEKFDVEFLIGEMIVKTVHQINKLSFCFEGEEDCILTMVYIPGTGDLPGFYVSETPITIQQYKALYPKDVSFVPGSDLHRWFYFLDKYGAREYEEFTVVAPSFVDVVLDFVNKIRQPITYCLPTREQWLHLAENYYERVKWCIDSKFLGFEYKAVAWEMMQDNSYDIYCLLGVVYENGKRVIKGNNFRKKQERDNIAFRLVCSESDINSYSNNSSYENR